MALTDTLPAQPDAAPAPIKPQIARPPFFARAFFRMPFGFRHARVAHAPHMAKFHRIAAAKAVQGETPWLTFATRCVDWWCWPFVAYQRVRLFPEAAFNFAAEDAGRSPLRHFLATWWHCTRLGIQPDEYHGYLLYKPERTSLAGEYLFTRESNRVFLKLYEISNPRAFHAIDDKVEMAELCRNNGLSAVQALAIAEKGEIRLNTPRESPEWRNDLIMKPRRGSNGSGFYRWLYQNDDRYRGALGETLTLDEVFSQIERLSKSRVNIVQRRIVNDPETQSLSSGALATVRVMTGRHKDGSIRVITAAVKLPAGTALVDNYKRGNVIVQVDASTGTMLQGVYYLHQLTPIDTHPETGVTFTGRKVPQWDEIVTLALAAHAMVPEAILLAFDIAPSAEGPVLIEANTRGDVSIVQYPGGKPLGQTAYPEVIGSHF